MFRFVPCAWMTYGKKDAYAQNSADRSFREDDKALWLQIAQGWRDLIHRPTGEEAFDAAAKKLGTGQKTSGKSN
jgi:hypothetical protein